MAKFPDVYERRTPARSQRAVTRDNSAAILGAGVSDIIEKREEKADRLSYAKAKSELLTADIEARRELEDDDDWASFDERYQEKMSEARSRATEHIRDKNDRALFEEEATMSIARGRDQVLGKARAREVQWGQADLNDGLDSLREAALNAEDEQTRIDIIETVADRIGSANERGYVDDVAAERLGRTWRKSYGEGYLSVQHPDKRIELLQNPKGTPVEFLDSDVRAKMLDAAKKESETLRVRKESQAQTDAIMDGTDDLSKALTTARKITDPAVRDRTVARVKYRFNEIDVINRERDADRFEAASNLVEAGAGIEEIPARDWTELSMPQRRALEVRRRQVQTGEEPIHDDAKYYEWSQMPRDDRAQVNLMAAYRPYFDDSHFNRAVEEQKAIRDAIAGGRESQARLDSSRSDAKRIEQGLIESGMFKTKPTSSSKNKAQMGRWSSIESEIMDLIETESNEAGKKLSPVRKQEIIDNVILQRVFVDDTWPAGNEEKLGIELTTEEREFAFIPFDDIPPIKVERLRNYASSRGWRANRDAIERAYAAARLGMGDAEIDRRLQGQ